MTLVKENPGSSRPIGAHAGTYVRLLVQDLDITNATTGETLRELVLDPTRDYQPHRSPRGPDTEMTNGPTIP
jgi:hypothetical protein